MPGNTEISHWQRTGRLSIRFGIPRLLGRPKETEVIP